METGKDDMTARTKSNTKTGTVDSKDTKFEIPSLERNIGRLHVQQPGADCALAWLSSGSSLEIPSLNDGNTDRAVILPQDTVGVGIEWPIQHVVDGVTLFLSGEIGGDPAHIIEIHDEDQWRMVADLRIKSGPGNRGWSWTFEPVATRSLRVRLPQDEDFPPPTELEVYRYLPENQTIWPDRLTKDNQLEREIRASGREASFEFLASCALSMTPAHAMLGLKDHPREVAVTWDGKLISPKFDPETPLNPQNVDYKRSHGGTRHYTLSFAFGDKQANLADYRDTVTRKLIGGWMPGTIVTGRIQDLSIRQTAFMYFVDDARTRPALFVRMEMTNLSDARMATVLTAQVTTKTGEDLRVVEGCLTDEGSIILIPSEPTPKADQKNALRFDLELAPGQTGSISFVQPHGMTPLSDVEAYRSSDFDAWLSDFKEYWETILAPAMTMELPEDRLNRMYRAVLAQLFVNADGDIMPYGSEPSQYAGNLYGVEESYAMMALAYAGFIDDAKRYMAATYLTPRFLRKVPVFKEYADRHQQYRNGMISSFAVGLYRVVRDKTWIREHLPLLRQCAEWTIENRRRTMIDDGDRPLHWGLLPKWSYGGDLSKLQCYTLFSNLACWKGLVDTAWLLGELGDSASSRRYREEAADYRKCIDHAIEGTFLPDHNPPCLPLHLYVKNPEPQGEHSDFYHVMSVILLHLMAFEPGGRHERFITEFLEKTNRMFCLMPRFRRDVGAGGINGIYGIGYVLSKLHQDKIDEFILAFYGYLAFNLERETFVSRETNLIYASDLHVASSYPVPDASDPLPCSSAVALNYLRHLLVTEELDGPGRFSGNLRVLWGAPRAWFRDGRQIRFGPAPTHFGTMTCEVTSDVARGTIQAIIRPPKRSEWTSLKLRLRHPDELPFRQVTVNGEPWKEFDAKCEIITLLPGQEKYRVEVTYR